jgi:hypothetical protein
MLNGMQQLMTGSNEPFDPLFYEMLVSCFNKIEEPRLLNVVDAQWKGLLDFSEKLGTDDDPWRTCLEPFDGINKVIKIKNLFFCNEMTFGYDAINKVFKVFVEMTFGFDPINKVFKFKNLFFRY